MAFRKKGEIKPNLLVQLRKTSNSVGARREVFQPVYVPATDSTIVRGGAIYICEACNDEPTFGVI